jgi:hypothetical protein
MGGVYSTPDCVEKSEKPGLPVKVQHAEKYMAFAATLLLAVFKPKIVELCGSTSSTITFDVS